VDSIPWWLVDSPDGAPESIQELQLFCFLLAPNYTFHKHYKRVTQQHSLAEDLMALCALSVINHISFFCKIACLTVSLVQIS
jgi:hypothetical protein